MKVAPSEAPSIGDPRLSQSLTCSYYRDQDEDYRATLRREASSFRFEYEVNESFFDLFFPDFDTALLRGSTLLDLGSLTGGRTAAWTELLELNRAYGVDVDVEFARAAREFATTKEHDSHFCVAYGEAIPYRDESFDNIATYDVLEHVQDPEAVMAEAFRVLKPGGRMFAVFPTYFSPFAGHHDLATRMHGLNLLFSGSALAAAHHDVISERGVDHEWYNSSRTLPSYYKSPFLNGITVRRFKAIVAQRSWEIETWPRKPILSVGRRVDREPFRTISKVLKPFSRLPVLEEVLLASVSVTLVKGSK